MLFGYLFLQSESGTIAIVYLFPKTFESGFWRRKVSEISRRRSLFLHSSQLAKTKAILSFESSLNP